MSKAKYWTAVLYPESMVDDWENKISDLLQVAYEYCIHDKDIIGHNEDRKTHVHVVIAFNNTTTYKHALSLFQRLQPNCSFCEQVLNIRYIHEYLIHNTDSCKKANKHLYDACERISGNNFDLGSYDQLSLNDKRKMLKELCDFIVFNNIGNFTHFYEIFLDVFGLEYFEVVASYSGFLERLCRGVYLRNSVK